MRVEQLQRNIDIELDWGDLPRSLLGLQHHKPQRLRIVVLMRLLDTGAAAEL